MQLTCNFPDGIHPIGTKVYLPQPSLKNVVEDHITGYYCVVLNDEQGMPNVILTDYRLTHGNVGRGTLESRWKDNEFFLSHEEAKEMAVQYKIEATPDEWFKAIGMRCEENEVRVYDHDCELAPCCAVISDIRDILYEACQYGLINGVNRKSLIDLLNLHDPAPEEDSPVLAKILSQLGIVWSGKTSPYVTLLNA